MSFLLKLIRCNARHAIQPRMAPVVMIVAGLSLVLISLLSIGATVRASPMPSHFDAPLQQAPSGGKAIFDEKCAACHTIGGGKLVGPDLKDITKLRDLQWIKNFILDPAKMIATDAEAKKLFQEYNNFAMPNMGLTADQVDQVVQYLENPGETGATPGTPVSPGVGDPLIGKHLFTGEVALKNGGPSCISCHNVIGTGALGGGGLGPDLTQVVLRFGEPGLASALKTLPFPTMMGPFQNHPLAPEDQAALVAFFKETNQQQALVANSKPGVVTAHVLLFFGIGLAAAVLLFGLLWLIWVPLKKRYQPRLPVRKV